MAENLYVLVLLKSIPMMVGMLLFITLFGAKLRTEIDYQDICDPRKYLDKKFFAPRTSKCK